MSTGYEPRLSPAAPIKKYSLVSKISCHKIELVGELFKLTVQNKNGWNSRREWSIDKLDGSNWQMWKFQMRHLLLAKGLWGLVDGTEELQEDADDQHRAEFERRRQKAFSSMVMAISTAKLTSYDQPQDAWDALRNHFERETLANKLFLKKYFHTEMKDGTSMEAHLKHMKEITDKLAAIGSPINEEDQVVTLLGSLPQSYSTIVTALEARADDITLNFVQQALTHEETKIKDFGHQLSPISPQHCLLGPSNMEKGRRVSIVVRKVTSFVTAPSNMEMITMSVGHTVRRLNTITKRKLLSLMSDSLRPLW